MSEPMSEEVLARYRRIAEAEPGTMREFWREEGRAMLAEIDRLRALVESRADG